MASRTQRCEQPIAIEVNSEAKKKTRDEDYNFVRPETSAEYRVVNAVARAAVKAKIKNSGTQRRIMDTVTTRIAHDQSHGKSIPMINVYDKDVLAKAKAVERTFGDSKRTR